MKTLLALLIATSLTANAWLVLQITANHAAPALVKTTAASAAPEVAPAGAIPLTALQSGSPATWQTELRTAGADDATTRAIIEGLLRQRYGDALKSLRLKRQAVWWRSDARSEAGDENRLLTEIVRGPLRETLGRDPLDVSDAERRYDFLPPAKRRLLAEIALDYEDLGSTGAGWISGNTIQADIDKQRLLADERRNDVLAALTPAERAEYDLRFEGSAGLLAARLTTMNGTEQEFRELRPVLDAVRQREKALPREPSALPNETFLTAFAEFTQQSLDTIAAAIGPDRALDYQWSGPGLYAELVCFVQERELPSTTAARIMQLAAETGARASAIHHDDTIPIAEKGLALQRLQAEVRRDFDRLVPESLRANLPVQAVDWFTLLAQGRYMGFTPSLLSTGTGVTMPTAVSTSVGGRAWSPPPRPRGLDK